MTIALVTIVLAVAIVLMVTEKLPLDLTAIGIMVVLMVLGLLAPKEAVSGFAHPAPLTVGALFIVSRGLTRTGALDLVSKRLIAHVKGSRLRMLALSLVVAGVFSAFMNNTPVVVLFISVVMAVCCEYSFSPSRFLLPISFVSILFGSATLIGTSTNIIVSDLGVTHGQDAIGMFELTALGAPIAVVGTIYLLVASLKILKPHKEPICELAHSDKQRYISELRVPSDSLLVGRDPRAALREEDPTLELYEVLRGDQVLDPRRTPQLQVEPRDILLVKASAKQLVGLLDRQLVRIPKGDDGTIAKPYDLRSLIIELIVPPRSEYIGRPLENVTATLDAHIHLLGVKRRQMHYSWQKVRQLRLSVGDILLVQTPQDHLDTLRAGGDLIVVEDVVHRIVNTRKAPLAAGIFLAMVAAATVGLADIMVCALAATFLMLVTGCLSLRDAYRSVDVKVVLLIIGTLALGAALQDTGAAELYATTALGWFEGASPQVVLSVLIALTSVLSLFLSNNATAVLLVPIGLSAAEVLGVDSRPFLVGICFGASACFASPVGYQTNLLVYGAGGYRFLDYVKLGAPLNVLVWAAATIFVPILWPF